VNEARSYLVIWVFLIYIVGPVGEPVSVVMKLSNKSDKKVCFKLKTTAPDRYTMEPTTGIVKPKGNCKVKVTLEPLDSVTEYNHDSVENHKFQVLATLAPEGEFNIETLVLRNIYFLL
jgi:hypothetical protein